MARTKTPVPELCSRQVSSQLVARAMEWQNLAAKLEQRADAWSEEATRWEHGADPRASISGYRTQWVAEQARQFAAWLRLASDHLATLGTGPLQ